MNLERANKIEMHGLHAEGGRREAGATDREQTARTLGRQARDSFEEGREKEIQREIELE